MQKESKLKLIKHNAAGIDGSDDPTYPFKLELNLRPPEFMEVTYTMLYGNSEEVIVRSMTLDALNHFINENRFRTHVRLRRLIVTGPGGVVESVGK